MTRNLTTTYYGPGKNKPVVKVTHGSRIGEALPNIVRHMTCNDYGAVVATVHDDETAQLLLVATYDIGSRFRVAFEAGVNRPICIIS